MSATWDCIFKILIYKVFMLVCTLNADCKCDAIKLPENFYKNSSPNKENMIY